MLRERKIVLFVMGDEEILERSRMVVSQLALEYSVKIARNYSAAYKIIVEHQGDVMVCGPAEEQFHQNIVDAYRFMESARRLKRYRDTPMILISDVEDPNGYCDRELCCFAVIDTLSLEHRLCETLVQALEDLRCKSSWSRNLLASTGRICHLLYL